MILRGTVRWCVLAAAWVVCVVGCGADQPAPRSERSAQAPDADRLTDRPRRGTIVGGEKVDRVVRWPQQEPHEVGLQPPFRTALADSSVPVLAPASIVAPASLQVIAGETWTAVSAEGDGFSVSLQANKQARLYPHVRAAAPTATIRDHDGFVSRNEGIWVASWIENGVAYSLELECDRPFEAECADDAFLYELAEDLVFIGGSGV